MPPKKHANGPTASAAPLSTLMDEDLDDAQYQLISQAPFMMAEEDFMGIGSMGGYTHDNTQPGGMATGDESVPHKKRGRKPKVTAGPPPPASLPTVASPMSYDPFDPDMVVPAFISADQLPIPKKKGRKRAPPVDPAYVEPQPEEKAARRLKRPWTVEEEEFLTQGVQKYGLGQWAKIRDDSTYAFLEGRTSVDLKDKWRNMVNFKRYRDHEIRKYVLLDERHEFLVTSNKQGKTSGYHYFHNRWPREAAMKVATRDEFYSGPEDGGPIMIYLREIVPMAAPGEEKEETIVHVYRGTRVKRVAVDIPKFKNKKFMWEPAVTKVREERLSAGNYAVVPCHVDLPEDMHAVGNHFEDFQLQGLI